MPHHIGTPTCAVGGVLQLTRMAPLAFVHTLGNLLTNVSLGAVAVSFTHTIKACEPLFSVALSMLVLGDRPHPAVIATLVPIIGGVAVASMSEVGQRRTPRAHARAHRLHAGRHRPTDRAPRHTHHATGLAVQQDILPASLEPQTQRLQRCP